MNQSLHRLLRKIIYEMINRPGHVSGDRETIKVLRMNGGKEFNVVSVNGKIQYVADARLTLDTHDKHFIKEIMSILTDCHRVVITGSSNGSKFFKAKSKGKVYQFRRGRDDGDGISVFIDDRKIDNPLRKNSMFINFPDVIRYLTTNHK